MKLKSRLWLAICPLFLAAAIIISARTPPPEEGGTIHFLGEERTVTFHPDGSRSVAITEPVFNLVSGINAQGESKTKCVTSSAEKEAFLQSIDTDFAADR